MSEKTLYDAVVGILNQGHNVEIKRKPDGTIQIIEIKKEIKKNIVV